MAIDLCIVNFNTNDCLQRFLDTLHSDGPKKDQWVEGSEWKIDPAWKLYIADNGSSDNSINWLAGTVFEQMPYPDTQVHYWVEHVDFNQNIGYARACNHLASLGNSDIIALLNADVWMTTKDVRDIEEIFKQNPDIAILGPKQRSTDDTIVHAGIFGRYDAPAHRGWREHDPNDTLYRDRLEAVTVSGSAFFIRRSVWNELTNCPLYRDLFPDAMGAFMPCRMYYEETYCAYHARAHGYRAFYDGSVSIGHQWHASSPVGSQTPKFHESQAIFRMACDYHGIAHD